MIKFLSVTVECGEAIRFVRLLEGWRARRLPLSEAAFEAVVK
jgi:hypothetical protein